MEACTDQPINNDEPRKDYVTLQQIADATGLSRTTVSDALRGANAVAPDTRAHVWLAAKKLGYRRNPALSLIMTQLRQRKSGQFLGTVALVGSGTEMHSHSLRIRGCERRAAERGYSYNYFCAGERPHAGLSRIFRMRGIVGAVVVDGPVPDDLAGSAVACPVVAIGMQSGRSGIPCVSPDYHQIAFEGFGHLREAQCRRIITVVHADRLVKERLAGGVYAAQAGVPRKNRLPVVSIDSTGRSQASVLKRMDPDGIMLFGVDRVQLGAPGHCPWISLDLRPSDEAAGFDHQHELLGEKAVDILHDRIRDRLWNASEKACVAVLLAPKFRRMRLALQIHRPPEPQLAGGTSTSVAGR